MKKIYVVDDETELLKIIEKYLKNENYAVTTFSTGERAMAHVGDTVHLWLLDIMLGGEISGYDLIRAIREKNTVPVVFMSARDQELDRILGLEMGSDDYITKPFSMRELVLRINNVIKRTYVKKEVKVLQNNGYTIDLDKRTISKGKLAIPLTSKETDMVLIFVKNKGMSFTRDQLLNHVWGETYFGSDRVVDDLVKRIRKKLPGLNIETIYGLGYRLV